MKTYTKEQVMAFYTSKTKSDKISILTNALDYMQQFNGRSKFLCIAMAMGFKENSQGNYIK